MSTSSSRYASVGRAMLQTADGWSIPYLRRRIIAPVDAGQILMTTTLPAGSRLDLVAAKLRGDPLQAWRLADANDLLDPAELDNGTPRALRIPKPGV